MPKITQPSTMASRKAQREAEGRTTVRRASPTKARYGEPFTMPVRVPVKDRSKGDAPLVGGVVRGPSSARDDSVTPL